MKNFFTAFLLAVILSTSAAVSAEVKTYTGVGEYYMSDFETPNIAQQRAKQRAEQDACEQAGVYVKSFSQARNLKLIDDVIITMTNGILKLVEGVQYQRENFDNNTTLIRATIKADIDSDDIANWLRANENKIDELVRQNEKLRNAIAEQDRQIAELKQKLAAMNTKPDEERITQQFAAEDKIFLSNQKVSEGWQAYNRRDYNGAVKLFDEAAELNPQNAQAYYGRAYALDDLKNFPQAISDCTRAIELNPNYAEAYNNRGEAYRKSGEITRAIADYNKAIQLDPNYFRAYNNRAIAYRKLGNYEQTFADYERALAIKPDYALAYYNRAYAYMQLKNYSQAVADFGRYIELVPNDKDAYINRGICYKALGDIAKAQADFAEAKRLGAD